jgi:hypothetical protein
VELTGPYFHNGGAATLQQVVEFYSRGGNFPALNIDNLDPLILELKFSPAEEAELVAFLKSLTDERVRNMSAPFDHPELFVPNGLDANGNEEFLVIPEVGAAGRTAFGLPLLQAFPSPPGGTVVGGVSGDTGSAPAGGGGGGGCFIGTVLGE